jgi:DNA-binding NtrC family response regulator
MIKIVSSEEKDLRAQRQSSTMSETDEIPFGPGPLKGLLVLVAEDDPWTAEHISLILEEEGGRLLGPCRSVAQARDLLTRYEVQFVLIDLNLADNFADELISDVVERQIPFVLITGYEAFPSNVDERAIAVLRKPFSRRRLVELMSRFA